LAVRSSRCNHPEAIANILVRILEKTPTGGATIEDLEAVNFHASQQVTELENGEIEVVFRLTGANEMIPWLASWGPDIKVLEPDWLGRETAAYLTKALNNYNY